MGRKFPTVNEFSGRVCPDYGTVPGDSLVTRGRRPGFRHVFVLARRKGVLTDAHQGLCSLSCWSCGAPVTEGTSAKCPYCASPLSDGMHQWVLAAVQRG